MKKRVILFASVFGLVGVLLGVGYNLLFAPVSLLSDLEEYQVLAIRLYEQDSDGNVQDRKLLGYDEKAVLEYLSSCQVRRTYDVSGDYQFAELDMEIVLEEGDGYRCVYLGENSFTNNGWGSRIHKILKQEEVKEGLYDLLGLDSRAL